jgi:hypothetical protein
VYSGVYCDNDERDVGEFRVRFGSEREGHVTMGPPPLRLGMADALAESWRWARRSDAYEGAVVSVAMGSRTL